MLLHHPLPTLLHSPELFASVQSIHHFPNLSLLTLSLSLKERLNGRPLSKPNYRATMAVSLNSVISFNPAANYQQVSSRTKIQLLSQKLPFINPLSGPVGLGQSMLVKKSRIHLLAVGGDNIATETSDNSNSIEELYSKNGSSDNVSGVDPSTKDDKIKSNGAVNSTSPNQEESVPESSSTVKRAPLTAKERLRAARVLSHYTKTKPSKPELGSKLLDALQENDMKGGKKRSGLPQAPTNLFDDSKRGMPKEGWTIDLPAGMDVFFIVFSFVFISSVMFATTYLVWKVGAIHFNEY